MSNPIVLSFHPDGEIEYTRNSDFTPFDGRGDMRRVTDIRKEPYGAKYFIHWMLGPWTGCDHTRLIARNYFNPDDLIELERQGLCPKFSPEHMRSDERMLFDTYELAVAHEVAMLNEMRRRGVRFA